MSNKYYDLKKKPLKLQTSPRNIGRPKLPDVFPKFKLEESNLTVSTKPIISYDAHPKRTFRNSLNQKKRKTPFQQCLWTTKTTSNILLKLEHNVMLSSVLSLAKKQEDAQHT